MEFKIEFYKTATQSPIEDFITDLEEPLQIKIFALLKRLRENPFVLKDYSKKITENLFELRLYYLQKWIRIIYAFEKNKIIILLHGFIKKSNKTPANEIEVANQRLIQIKKIKG